VSESHPCLDRIELLSSLSPAERATLARHCKWRRFEQGEQIVDRASDTQDLCFVVEGRVRIVNHSLNGREISFDDVEVGGFFGELSAIDGGPRSATVVAEASTQVAFLAPRRFEELIQANPKIGLAVMRRLAGMVRRSTERIMDLSTLGANNRVHAELIPATAPKPTPPPSARFRSTPISPAGSAPPAKPSPVCSMIWRATAYSNVEKAC